MIPLLGVVMQKDHKFEASLSYIARTCSRKKITKRKGKIIFRE
jgi:hypothetical protein